VVDRCLVLATIKGYSWMKFYSRSVSDMWFETSWKCPVAVLWPIDLLTLDQSMVIRGVPPPDAMMHFPHCFRFLPLFQKKICDSVQNVPDFSFFRKKFRFSSAKISDDLSFFSHHPQIWKFPPLFSYFLHISGKSFFPPYFVKFPLWFRKIFVFCTCFLWFSFPPTLTMINLCITQCTYWLW